MSATGIPTSVFCYSLAIVLRGAECPELPVVTVVGTKEEIKESICTQVDAVFRAFRRKRVGGKMLS